MSTTKDMLEQCVEYLNKKLKAREINRQYEIGYRNSNCCLDEKSNTHEYCIVKTIAYGSKRDIHESINMIVNVIA